MTRSWLLATAGIGVADWPEPFPRALAGNAALARSAADLLHEHSDAVIWAFQFDDLTRLRIIDSASRANGGGRFQTKARVAA